MKSDVIGEITEAQLPNRYEPLLLTFYGNDVRTNGHLATFGDDSGTDLCLNLEDGFIYSLDPKHELPTRFVNTNVRCLANFIAAHQQYVTAAVIETSSAEEQLQIVRMLSEQLVSLDARALADPENWWAVVREQIENQLL